MYLVKGEILVKIKVIVLNFVDYKIGNGGNFSWIYFYVLGFDLVGVVEEVGEEVIIVKVGDCVVYYSDLLKKGGFV